MDTNDFRKFGNFLKKHNLTHKYWACVYKQGYSRKQIRCLYPRNYIEVIRNYRSFSADDLFWRVMDTYWQLYLTDSI